MDLKEKSALLLVDLITDFDFEDGEKLFTRTKPILRNIRSLYCRCKEAGIPVIYVNDPPVDGSRSRSKLEEHISDSDRGKFMLEAVGPSDLDPLVFKPHRSGFFETELEETLINLGAEHVLVAGVTTDICVLFTAHDAYMRRFEVSVPANCSMAVRLRYHRDAVGFLERVAEADVSDAGDR